MQLNHPASRAKGIDLMAGDRGRTRPRHKDATRGAAMAYRTTPHEVEAEAFSRELAEYLRLARTRNEYAHLVLVAPPSFLGQLREALDEPTRDCVRASIAKGYTGERPERVLARLREQL
jgi:protein required for attachment to host cells